jgi:hypothetical protein
MKIQIPWDIDNFKLLWNLYFDFMLKKIESQREISFDQFKCYLNIATSAYSVILGWLTCYSHILIAAQIEWQ